MRANACSLPVLVNRDQFLHMRLDTTRSLKTFAGSQAPLLRPMAIRLILSDSAAGLAKLISDRCGNMTESAPMSLTPLEKLGHEYFHGCEPFVQLTVACPINEHRIFTEWIQHVTLSIWS